MEVFITVLVLAGIIMGIAVLVYIEEKFTKPARRRKQQPLLGVVAPKQKTEDSYGPIPTEKNKKTGKQK